MLNDRIVAVGLLTQGDLALLGPAFDRAWPIDEAPCFTGLLEAIDEADRDLRRAEHRPPLRVDVRFPLVADISGVSASDPKQTIEVFGFEPSD